MIRRLAALAAGAALAAAPAPPAHAQALPTAGAHRVVSTTNPASQAAFDRGLAMLYAFNVGEARVSFARAAALDPNLGIAAWGEAVADTIDINSPQTDAGDGRGAAAVARAKAREAGASPAERQLIAAIAQRYSGKGSIADRFVAYAGAMTRFALRHPDDADGLTFAAYARWNAVADLVAKDGTPVAGAAEMAFEINRAIALDPANLGAHHLRIHLWEGLGAPERALPDAKFFDGLTFDPAMSHLPHMAGHAYVRVGDYDAVIASNRRAIAYDDAYFAQGDGEGQKYIRRYHDHDVDFIIYGLSTEGRDSEARAAVTKEDDTMRLILALRLHDNAAALTLAQNKHDDLARAVALARLGRTKDADAALGAAGAGRDDMAGMKMDGGDTGRAKAAIASAIVARAEGKLDRAMARYAVAIAALGTYPGDPKSRWQTPPGEGLGAVQLQAKKYARAERTFRHELERFPNDPRLAFGLAEALHAQNKDDTAERAVVNREWKGEKPLTQADLG